MRNGTGRNATRRSRNIGTSRQGRGQNNRMAIAQSWHSSKIFVENLGAHTHATRHINGHNIAFLVEENRRGCEHACTQNDIAHILRFVPPGDLDGLAMIVLRQPKRKEEMLSPVWGRWFPFVEIGKCSGSAIFLEAFEVSKTMRWSKSLEPDEERRLQRLREDGHSIREDGRSYIFSYTLDSIRTTQLYWTLLHEVGHHVDFRRDEEAFDRKARADKEAFASRYADEMQSTLRAKGALPFVRIA